MAIADTLAKLADVSWGVNAVDDEEIVSAGAQLDKRNGRGR
jgi:hypothetical protein